MQIQQAAEVAPVDACVLRRTGQRFRIALDQLLQVTPLERADALLFGLFERQVRVDDIFIAAMSFGDPKLEIFEGRVLRT